MKRRNLRSSWSLIPLLTLALAISLTAWSGCGNESTESVARPELTPTYDLTVSNPAIRVVMDAQNRHTPELMARDGVIGTATGIDAQGTPAIKIYTEFPMAANLFPAEIEGHPVVVENIGKIVAMKGKPGGGGGVSHTAIQSTPIQLGTSGGWAYDLANGYCCAGTLGSLISKGGKQYILSNYHVLEADIVNGGNNRRAQNGDSVIQPGLIDVGCNVNNTQSVASLSLQHALPNNNVDCAIAEVVPGMVSSNGAILEIGTLSSATVGASINQAVKKSGRTTGLTRSSVSGLNATVSVAYENECAGGSAFTKTFTGQIVISNRRSGFLAGGDSGSLMVEDVSNNPRAVGLLFAGSNTSAIANPINEVLSFLGASMVGN